MIEQKLSAEDLERVYEHARRWNTDNRLHDPVNASTYLEDRLAECTSSLIEFTDIAEHKGICSEEHLERVRNNSFQRTGFFVTVGLRYSQKKTGLPRALQQIRSYDSDDGNQVDNYLSEFFNV